MVDYYFSKENALLKSIHISIPYFEFHGIITYTHKISPQEIKIKSAKYNK